MRHKNKFGGDVSNRGHYSTNSNKALFSGNPPQNDQQHLHCLIPQNCFPSLIMRKIVALLEYPHIFPNKICTYIHCLHKPCIQKTCVSNNSKSLNIQGKPWKLMLGEDETFRTLKKKAPSFWGGKKNPSFSGASRGVSMSISQNLRGFRWFFNATFLGGFDWKAPPCHCQRWWVPQLWYKQRAPRCLRCEKVTPFESNHHKSMWWTKLLLGKTTRGM